MRTKFIAGLLLSLILSSGTAWAGTGAGLAVIDFKTVSAPAEIGIAVAEIIRTELVQTGKHTIIERSMLDRVLAEQKLQMSGIVDPQTAATVGKMSGASQIITGSVVKLGEVYTVTARLIDVETGVVRAGEIAQGKGEDSLPDIAYRLAAKLVGEQAGEKAFRLSFEEGEKPGVAWDANTDAPVRFEIVSQNATHGTRSLKVRLPVAEYPGITFSQVPADWRRYSRLEFDLYLDNPKEQASHMGIRIDDPDSHDYDTSYNWETRLDPGSNRIVVLTSSIADSIDISKVRKIHIYLGNLSNEMAFYLDNIQLK